MLRGLWRLAWLEIKIFLREPLGAIGGIAIPVVAFVIMSRVGGPRLANTPGVPRFITADLPIFAGLLTVASVVLSFVAIIAIYREGGILKRLRATPLRPYTILTAHVVVKLLFTAVTLAALVVAGRRRLSRSRAACRSCPSPSRSSTARCASSRWASSSRASSRPRASRSRSAR